ncbi:hypothetical protein ACO1PF_01295 [Alkalibacterium sp. f15]|uniref:hypothetical protein n=1 Tax=Alkalibacterium sp. f15 TaxID=3414029 RepID=UPI003BF91931
MNREAINYVKEAEARVVELRANAEIEIREIEEYKEQEINTHKNLTEQEVAKYQKEKYDELGIALRKDEIVIDETVQEETVKFDAAYKEKKDTIANRIAEEVLRKYGNS